jgi:hypothetical protein
MQIIGSKYGLTKTSVKGTYDFQFLQDANFLAKSEEEKKRFIELQMNLRHKRKLMKERYEN